MNHGGRIQCLHSWDKDSIGYESFTPMAHTVKVPLPKSYKNIPIWTNIFPNTKGVIRKLSKKCIQYEEKSLVQFWGIWEYEYIDVDGVYQELVEVANQRHIDLTK